MSSSSNNSNDREATKRLAQQGQWKTPPLPVFASSGTAATASITTNMPISDLEGSIPTTPDEYARMLQEAYKRGAEAASRGQLGAGGDNAAALMMGEDGGFHHGNNTNHAAVPSSQMNHHGMTAPPRQFVASNTQPAPPFGAGGGQPTAPPKSVMTMHANAANNYNFPLPQQVPAMVVQQPPPPPSIINNNVMKPGNIGGVHKATSLPDIASFHHHQETATDEEEKRKKRLARNRASARLRRLKKKNLVDSYEGEVGILEAALNKLRSHRWSDPSTYSNQDGSDGNNNHHHEALIEALSMERGQQLLTPQSRRTLIQSIVTQQKSQVDNLLQCQLENWMLSCLANNNNNNDDEEMNQLTSELASILQLTPQQKADISKQTTDILQDISDLRTISSCLDAILQNEWLLDSGVDEIASQFTSILNPSQISKFLLWTDHNAESIDKLDYVNLNDVVGVGNEKDISDAPVFEFGVDEGIEGGD
eukprot:scaffold236107_cov74-Cyclotella_meneghiniana.AAC.1